MKQSYVEKLKSPEWQKKRLQIMNRDKFTCKKCGDTETQLHVHHKEYIDGLNPWEYDNGLLVTLCKDCHLEIEMLKSENILFDRIKIYKSNKWSDGGRVVFISYPGACIMNIYDDKGGYVTGFDFYGDTDNIIKILKYGQKIY